MRFLLPVCLSVPERCFYQEFLSGIREALQELGHATELLPFRKMGEVSPEETSDLRAGMAGMKLSEPALGENIALWKSI